MVNCDGSRQQVDVFRNRYHWASLVIEDLELPLSQTYNDTASLQETAPLLNISNNQVISGRL